MSYIDQLKRLVVDRNVEVRMRAVRALGDIIPKTDNIIEILKHAALDRSEYVRQEAAYAIGRTDELNDEALDFLINMAGDKSSIVRTAVVCTLGNIQNASVGVMEFLAFGAFNNDGSVRCYAVNSPKVIELFKKLTDDVDESVREAVAAVLGNFRQHTADTLAILFKLIKDGNEIVKYAAYTTLEKIKNPSKEVIEALESNVIDQYELTQAHYVRRFKS